MPEDHTTSPLKLPHGETYNLVEYDSLEEALLECPFNGHLRDLFGSLAISDDMTSVRLHHPIEEPEYARYFRSTDALSSVPYILSANKHTYLDQHPKRNFLYTTLSIAHKAPNHPLNKDFVMQWRVHFDVVNGLPVYNDIKFCIKTRPKDLQRMELEVKVDSMNRQTALNAILEKYGDRVPESIRTDIDGISSNTAISSISVTSRTGYNGIQLRKKWGLCALHKFSHDVQRAVSPAILTPSGELAELAQRMEFEDEVEALHSAGVLDHKIFNTATKGSLHVHSGFIDTHGKVTGNPITQSNLSKAVFAEKAALGERLDDSVNLFDKHRERTMTRNQVFKLNPQPEDLHTNETLQRGLVSLATRVPEKGTLFPQNFIPNSPERSQENEFDSIATGFTRLPAVA